jgi:hypothetical protein
MRTIAQSHLDTVAGRAFLGMPETAALTEKGDLRKCFVLEQRYGSSIPLREILSRWERWIILVRTQ